MLACLFHYNLDVSLLMRYLGQNYTAAHRNVHHIVDKIAPHVEPYLIPHFIRVMTDGCPNVFNAEGRVRIHCATGERATILPLRNTCLQS